MKNDPNLFLHRSRTLLLQHSIFLKTRGVPRRSRLSLLESKGFISMTIPEILKELEPYTGRFPMEAMRAAIEQRETITPELVRVVEAIAANPAEVAKRDDYMLPVFALYLLAQFREKRAYPAIVKMFSAPGETSFDLVGDTVTEGLKQVLASVYDG